MKNKLVTIGIIIATLILAGVAVFTAIRLYQLRQQSVAPTAPTSKPKAAEETSKKSCTALTFNLSTTPPTTHPLTCNSPCTVIGSSCGQGLSCVNVSTNPNTAIFKCRNTQCSSQAGCVCPTTTPTPTPTNPPGNLNSCGGTCGSDANCNSAFTCYQGFCRNPSCQTSQNCVCAPTPPPGTQASLPSSGTSLPSILGVSLGSILLIGAIILAL